MADATRREIRKRKILLNSESRLSKLSSHNNVGSAKHNTSAEVIPCTEITDNDIKNEQTKCFDRNNEAKEENVDTLTNLATVVEAKDHNTSPKTYTFNILRALTLVISTLLFFHHGKLWSMLTKFTNVFPDHDMENQSFLIWFCLTECIILFFNLENEVLSDTESNLLMLGLRLCGVSEVFLGIVQQIKLRCSEMMTNLTLFLFMIVVIQNISELL